MLPFSRTTLALAGLTMLGILTHLVPHQMGFTTVGALSMLCAAYLPRHLLALPVLTTVLVGDLLVGTYAFAAMGLVYLAHLAAAFVIVPSLMRVSAKTVILAAGLNAIIFYLISNVSQIALAFYPNTAAGWVDCYVAGLPFLLKGILANLAFGGLAFGCVRLIGHARAHRIATS